MQKFFIKFFKKHYICVISGTVIILIKQNNCQLLSRQMPEAEPGTKSYQRRISLGQKLKQKFKSGSRQGFWILLWIAAEAQKQR